MYTIRQSWKLVPIILLFVAFTSCELVDDSQDAVTDVDTGTIAQPGGYYGEAMGMGSDDEFTKSMTQQSDTDLSRSVTVCNGSTKVYGIDVSYYQGSINWTKVKAAGKNFAYIRYSDGTGFVDPNFTANWKNAKAAGLTVGAYQFFRASQNATTQADMMVDKLVSLGGTGRPNLPPVIDVETNNGMSNATVISKVNTWLARVKARTGRQCVLYTSPGYWNGLGAPQPNPLPYLWVAHWGVSCPSLPAPWGRLRFWQYSATGSVSGISGDVDVDSYNGSLTEMQGL